MGPVFVPRGHCFPVDARAAWVIVVQWDEESILHPCILFGSMNSCVVVCVWVRVAGAGVCFDRT